MKLRSKVHLYSSVLFAVLFIAANVTVYFIFSRMSVNHELQKLEAETLQASATIRQTADRLSLEELLRAFVPLDGMIEIVREESTASSNRLTVTSSSEIGLIDTLPVFHAEKRTEVITYDGASYGFASIPYIA